MLNDYDIERRFKEFSVADCVDIVRAYGFPDDEFKSRAMALFEAAASVIYEEFQTDTEKLSALALFTYGFSHLTLANLDRALLHYEIEEIERGM